MGFNVKLLLKPSRLTGTVKAPSSKSHAHRAMICAALCESETVMQMSTICEDTQATIRCLRALGNEIEYNGTEIKTVPHAFSTKGVFDCGESGSTLRFMLPVVCAAGCEAEFIGRGRLGKRPIKELIENITSHGITAKTDSLPLFLSGKMQGGDFYVSGDKSSQFLTGLLLALPICNGGKITLTSPLQSRPYVELTMKIMSDFGVNVKCDGNNFTVLSNEKYISPNKYSIEGDWSNAAFWLASGVKVTGLNEHSAQGDRAFANVLSSLGAVKKDDFEFDLSHIFGNKINVSDIPDLVMPLSAVCACADGTSVIYGGERLKLKESDRLKSVYDMLKGVGANITPSSDGFIINGKKTLDGGYVNSQNDHRIAMACAVLAQHSKNAIILDGAEAVNKSYPTFWDEYKKLGGSYELLQD